MNVDSKRKGHPLSGVQTQTTGPKSLLLVFQGVPVTAHQRPVDKQNMPVTKTCGLNLDAASISRITYDVKVPTLVRY